MHSITIENLSKSFGKKKEKTTALADLNLSVYTGELFGLIGPDGAGKTTLFRILTSLLLPNQGTVRVLGLDPVHQYRALRQRIGYMPGRFSLYPDLTVEENLQFFARVYSTTVESNYCLIEPIYKQLLPFKTRRAGKLSGGMKQKLALCCALIHRPELLLLDEPTTGVDPVSRKEFWEMLKGLQAEGITVVVATPYMDEASLCQRVAFIQKGKILITDTPSQINADFPGTLLEISGAKPYQLLEALEDFESMVRAYSFGAAIHLHLKDPTPDFSALEMHLKANGILQAQIQSIPPHIEDSFIARLSTH